MLARKDKKRLPIGLIPNGYSNDICRSLGIKSFDQALDFILKRETISIDTVRCLIDREDDRKLPSGPERMQQCRYMLAGAQLSMPAKIAQQTKWLGMCSFANPVVTFYKGVTFNFLVDNYFCQVDGKPVNESGQINTGLLVINNGKYINGGAVFNPYGVVNDGMIDMTWVHDPSYQGYWGMSGLMKKAQYQGGV